MSVMTKPPVLPARFRFTPEQFWDMHERGYFDGKRVELIGGEVVEMPAQSNEHYGTIEQVRDVLEGVLGTGFWVRMQATLDLSPLGMPDPDVAVTPGPRQRGRKSNPTTAVLIAEVSDSRLIYGRTTKASLYAAAGISEFWIVNVPVRQLEVHRDPQPDAAQEFGYGYASISVVKPGDMVHPLAAPNEAVAVADLFP